MVKSYRIPHLFEVAVLPGEERHSAVAGEAHQVRRPGPARRRHLDIKWLLKLRRSISRVLILSNQIHFAVTPPLVLVLDLAGAARRHLPGRSPPPPLAPSLALAYLRRFVVEINAGRQRNLLRLGSPYSRKYQSFISIAPAELFGNFRVGGVDECMCIITLSL